MVSGVKESLKEGRLKSLQKSIKQIIIHNKKIRMADQTVMKEVIAKVEAEATRAAIQTMVELHQRQEVQGPKLGGPVLKQPQFNWEAADKYTEWKAFILEVRDMLSKLMPANKKKLQW